MNKVLTFHDDNIWAFMIEPGLIRQSWPAAKLTDFKLATCAHLGLDLEKSKRRLISTNE